MIGSFELRILAAAAASSLALPSCGKGIAETFAGEIDCVGEVCEFAFQPVAPPREARRTVTVENTGTNDLLIPEIRIENSSPYVRFSDQTVMQTSRFSNGEGWGTPENDGGDIVLTGPDELALPPAERLAIELVFQPLETDPQCPSGDASDCGQVIVPSNDLDPEDDPQVFPISLQFNAGTLQVEPSVIQFPDPIIGSTFQEDFTISNVGTGGLRISNVGFTSIIPGLVLTNTSSMQPPYVLTPGTSVDYHVTWVPETADALDTRISITSDDPGSPVRNISVTSGSALGPDVEVDPLRLELGEVAMGETAEAFFDVSNTGQAPLTWSILFDAITPIEAQADFQIQTPSGSRVSGNQNAIQAGGASTFKLVYTPSAERSVQGSFSILSNDADESPLVVRFSAGPASPLLDVIPPQLFWGNVEPGQTQERGFVIYNNGEATLNVTNVAFTSGNDRGEFSFTPPATSFSVAPGGAYPVTVEYARAADDLGNVDQATLTLTSNSAGAPTTNVILYAFTDATNLPPTCVIDRTPPEPYSVGESISLDASASTASAGSLTASPFQWTLIPPFGGTARLSSRAGSSVTLVPDAEGTWVVGLTVSAVVNTRSITSQCNANLLVAE